MHRIPTYAGLLILVGLLLTACSNPKSLVDPAAPDVTVLSVPGMHWGSSCETRVRDALKTVSFVDADSIKTNLDARQASFRVKSGEKVDFKIVTSALQKASYPNATHLSGPKE